LKQTISYRKFSAAWLLVIYLFIAAPVSWWHQHAGTEAAGMYAGKSGDEQGITHPGDNSDCPVCSHHYSIYTDTPSFDISFDEKIPAVIHIPLCAASYNSLAVHSPGNKGPPADN